MLVEWELLNFQKRENILGQSKRRQNLHFRAHPHVSYDDLASTTSEHACVSFHWLSNKNVHEHCQRVLISDHYLHNNLRDMVTMALPQVIDEETKAL